MGDRLPVEEGSIRYVDSLEGVTADHLRGGFFVGWPIPPSPETHLRMLHGSSQIVLAIDAEIGMAVGFVTAVSDGVLAAYIPLLEVLPGHQLRGIGSELMRRMLAHLRSLYMVDLLCDADLQTYYERFEMRPSTGLLLRNYDRQSGESE